MPSYGVYESAVEIAASRVHNQACRFVNNQQRVIFINNIQWDIFRIYLTVIMRPVQHKRYNIAWTHSVVAFYRAVVDMYETRFSSVLNTISARMNKTVE